MTDRNDVPWLVLRTRSRQERIVEASLQHKRIDAYLPRRLVAKRSRGERRLIETVLFPGYVFVRPLVEQYETMRYVRGSCGLVLAGEKPAAMKATEVEAVRLLAESGEPLEVDTRLAPGCAVTVVAGPFEGARGEFVRVHNRGRLVINVKLINCSIRVDVDPEMVVVGH
jgi:transcription antitermination factor NusG